MQDLHALVVEDDPDISSALVETLEGAGFRVTSARDGRQAVEVAAGDPPDLVTLDLTLPHMDGIEVCRRIRESSDCYIVIVSARSDEVDKLIRAGGSWLASHPDRGLITRRYLGRRWALTRTAFARLAEIGDDRARFADARGLKAYPGSAPVTRASGKTTAVLHRRVKNQRLASVGYIWAFATLTASPGARAHYDRRKAAGDRHVAAQRNLFNRLLGCLHHCLHTGQTYNEYRAFTPPQPEPLPAAA